MRHAGTDSYACGIFDGCFAALGYPGTIGILLDLVAVTIVCIHHLRPHPRHDPSLVGGSCQPLRWLSGSPYHSFR